MSFAAAHESKHVRRLCQGCSDRKARYQYRGRIRADRNHTLCFECFRAERERQQALRLGDPLTGPGRVNAPVPPPLCQQPARPAETRWAQSGAASLSARQIAHRRAMLATLQAQRAAAEN